MTLPPSAWGPIYALQLLLVSLGLACVGVHQPRMLAGTRLSRFLIGFCVTPFVLGVWMLVVAAAFPGLPRWAFLLPPPAVAIASLAAYGSRTLRRMVLAHERIRRLSRPFWPICVSWAGASLVLLLVVYRLVIRAQEPVLAHDALVYLGEALAFAQQRSIDAAAAFRGWATGTTQGGTHNFVFPAYLAHALVTTGDNPLGYPYDHAVRVAFQATFVYMALSVIALGGIARYPGAGALTLVLTLLVPQFGLIASRDSRDAFRIIPLMLLAVVLAHLSPERLRHRIPLVRLIPPLILAAFVISGHTLGAIVTLTVVLAWVVWAIVGKARRLNVLLVAGAVAAGTLGGGFHYLITYIQTGRWSGYIATDYAVHNTPLESVLRQQDPLRLAAQISLVDRVGMLVGRDGHGLSIMGLAAALLALTRWSTCRQDRRARSLLLIGLMALTGFLPFLGVFDFGYPFSAGFVQNVRYALHWYAFAGACVAALVGQWYFGVKSSSKSHLRVLVIAPLVLFTVVSSGLSALEVTNWPPGIGTENELRRNIRNLQVVVRSLSPGDRLLSDDDRYSYYLNNQAITMYTRPTWEVIQAQNEAEVRDALTRLSIGAVALDMTKIPGWWDQIPLYAYLDNPDNAVLVDGGVSAVYRLVKSAAERDILLAGTLREVNVYDMPASYVVRAIDAGSLDGYPSELFPHDWQGPDTITMRDLPTVAPPLTILGSRGDFTFSRLSTGHGDVIRVSPDQRAAGKEEMLILFGPRIEDGAGGSLHIGPGQAVVLSLSARLSDSIGHATIFVKDRTSSWQTSQTRISGGSRQRYAVVRRIRPDATVVLLGVQWQPTGGREWLEIWDMQVFVVPIQPEAEPQEMDSGLE